MRDRRTFLGASDVASALGIGYRTPREVWDEKVSAVPIEHAHTEDTLRGLASEPVIEALLQLRGETLYPGGEWAIAGTPIIAHPDRRRSTVTGMETIDFKAPRRMWQGDPPQEYAVQVLIQAIACDATACRIVALCGDLRDFQVPWDRDTAERLVELASKWWQYHVVGGNEPPPVGRHEIAQIVPSIPALPVTDEQAAGIRRYSFWSQLASLAKRMSSQERDAILSGVLTGSDLPLRLLSADGDELATIRHTVRSSYSVAATEYNELRLSPAADKESDALMHHLDALQTLAFEHQAP